MDYEAAGVFRRLAAMLYDGLLLLALWMLTAAIAIGLNGGEAVSPNNPFMPSVLFLVTVGFYTYFWRRGGQTLGMRAWRIRLINDKAGPITGLQCALRCVSGIGSLVGFLGYGWLWLDKERKTWHDRASVTRVIVLPKDKAKATFH